jgi:drug/metabolite transporter (DMT)-like permease
MHRLQKETTSRRTFAFSPDVVYGVDHENQKVPYLNGHEATALPGRPRRRNGVRRSSRKVSYWHRFYSRWFKDVVTSFGSLFVAVFLWYILGVVSIATSKLLLMSDGSEGLGGVPPLFLTLQQLLIGSTLLRFLLKMHFLGSSGLQPWSSLSSPVMPPRSVLSKQRFVFSLNDYPRHLLLSGACFSIGFLATNFGFNGSSASFVETIKAAEPITSATVAVLWGIEMLSSREMTSLGAIVAGVLLSTLGNQPGSGSGDTSFFDSARACSIVMTANLCFSFRGLYQKLYRGTRGGNAQMVDDLNLQYRMQQIGVIILILPVLVWSMPGILWYIWTTAFTHGFLRNGLLLRYLGLSLINGCAFTSYNLASTIVLSRISVVHHAALNCIRRIFAIVVTSFAFNVPITLLGALGLFVSLLGFLSFTHFKVQRQLTPKPVSSLLPVTSALHHR